MVVGSTLDRSIFCWSFNMSKAVLDFLDLPDAGERIVRHLEAVSGRSLPGKGIVAGQACTSAILELCDEPGVVYNDVDIFLGAEEVPAHLKRKKMLRHGKRRMERVSFGAADAEEENGDGYAGMRVSRVLSLVAVDRDGPLNLVYGHSTRECQNVRGAGDVGESNLLSLLESFDLNSVKTGVDLATGQLVVAPSAKVYFRNRQLKIDFVHAGLQTFVRFLEKRALGGNYGDIEGARAVSFLQTLLGLHDRVAGFEPDGGILWNESASSRWETLGNLRGGAAGKGLHFSSPVLGLRYGERARKWEEVWGVDYDLLKVRELYPVYGKEDKHTYDRPVIGSVRGSEFFYVKPRRVPDCIVKDKEAFELMCRLTEVRGAMVLPGITDVPDSAMHFFRLFDKSTPKVQRERILAGCEIGLAQEIEKTKKDTRSAGLFISGRSGGHGEYVKLAWVAQTTRGGLVPVQMLQERPEMGARFQQYEKVHSEVTRVLMKAAPSHGLYQLLLKRLVDHNEDLWGMRDYEAVRIWNSGVPLFYEALSRGGFQVPMWLYKKRHGSAKRVLGGLNPSGREGVEQKLEGLRLLMRGQRYAGPKYALSPEQLPGVAATFELVYWMTSREFLSELNGLVLLVDLATSETKKLPMCVEFPADVYPGVLRTEELETTYGGLLRKQVLYVCEHEGVEYDVREGMSVLDLEEQGQKLRQCVGSYGSWVKSKRSRIFFLRRRGAGGIEEESTLEVGFKGGVSELVENKDGRLDRCKAVKNLQHRTDQNKMASKELEAFAEAIVESVSRYPDADSVWFKDREGTPVAEVATGWAADNAVELDF